jgi:hypothetical protein
MSPNLVGAFWNDQTSFNVMMNVMNNFNFVAWADHEGCTVRHVAEYGDDLRCIVMVVHEFCVTTQILELGLLGSQLAVKSLPGGNKVQLKTLKISKLTTASTQ